MCTLWFAAGLLFARQAAALPVLGDFDSAFNAGGSPQGVVLTPIGSGDDAAYVMALQADGKIIAAGQTSTASGDDFAMVRYNADGTLDSSFGSGGKVSADFGSASDYAAALVVQSDGKIVAAVQTVTASGAEFALARYNTDGTPDNTYGSGGAETGDFGSANDYATDLALQADGKLVVAGYRDDSGGGGFDYVVARYNSDGSLDTSFGTGGQVTTAVGNQLDWNVELALQGDGKIIIGSGFGTVSASDFFVARYTTDGVLDTTFNPGGGLAQGMVVTDMGGTFDAVYAVLVQPDGKIVASGQSNGAVFPLARYNTDGSLDTGFGTGGKLIYDFGSTHAWVNALAIQPNGKLLAAGLAQNGANDEFTVVRFTPDGTAEGGRFDAIGSSDSVIGAVAVQPDGRIVAAGHASNGTNKDFAVVRYTSNDAPWDLTPDAFSFTDVSAVGQGSVQTSNMITIAGLDGGTRVPVTVSGGEYAVNGGTTYTGDPGWVQNGDTVNVRHIAASGAAQSTETVLTVGGVMTSQNLAVTLGTTTSDTFSSTTGNGGLSSGGGAPDPWWLAILLAGGWWKSTHRRKAVMPEDHHCSR
jgi:uncharacterized delta-60 repeat protein